MATSMLSDIPGHLLIRGHRPGGYLEKKVVKEDLDDVLKALRIRKLNTLQEKMLVGLKLDVDLFVVGPKGIGKTTAYVVPLLLNFLEEQRNGRMEQKSEDGNKIGGPIAVIACTTTERAMYLESLLKNITFIQYAGAGGMCPVVILDSVDSAKEIPSSFHILIMTMPFLQWAVASSKSPEISTLGVNFERLKLVVFEDLMMQEGPKTLEVSRLMTYFLKDAGTSPENLRIIFCGSVWKSSTELVYERFYTDPETWPRKAALIFASAFEALKFSNLPFIMRQCRVGYNTKLNKLAEICKALLDDDAPTIVVACSSKETADCVYNFLNRDPVISKSLTVCEQNEDRDVFRGNTERIGIVYVVCDQSLESFVCPSVNHFINYDIDLEGADGKDGEPFSSKRFANLWNKLGKTEMEMYEMDDYNDLTIYALITGEERNFLPLYKYIDETTFKMPPPLKRLAERKTKTFIRSQPLCSVYKCCAFCTKPNCNHRHAFTAEDLKQKPEGPPRGEVEFKVIRCENPSLYFVRLLKHFVYVENDETRRCATVYRDEFLERMDKLREYYNDPKNRTVHTVISKGDKCGIQSSVSKAGQEMYFRVQVLNLPRMEGLQSLSRFVDVICLDTGSIHRVPMDKLMVLPKEFQNWNNHCVQVVLSNMVPPANAGNEYFAAALRTAKNLTEGKVWLGKILLSLGDTLWVNPMIECAPNAQDGQTYAGLNLKSELIQLGHVAYLNQHMHMKILQDHIRKVDRNFPEIEHEMNARSYKSYMDFHQRGDPIKWTSIAMSDAALNPVLLKVYAWVDPWEVYGAVMESRDENLVTPVIELEMEMTEEIETSLLPGLKSDVKARMSIMQTLKEGRIVAVKEEDGIRWRRGMILERLTKEAVCQKFNIFLVDYGTSVVGQTDIDQVVPLSKKFARKLPFQTVCFKMAHIIPIWRNQKWADENVEKMGEILTTDSFVNLVAYGKVKGTNHPCNYYEAFAMQIKPENRYKCECVGMQLVNNKMACVTPTYQNTVAKCGEVLDSLYALIVPEEMRDDLELESSDAEELRDEENDDKEEEEEQQEQEYRTMRMVEIEISLKQKSLGQGDAGELPGPSNADVEESENLGASSSSTCMDYRQVPNEDAVQDDDNEAGDQDELDSASSESGSGEESDENDDDDNDQNDQNDDGHATDANNSKKLSCNIV